MGRRLTPLALACVLGCNGAGSTLPAAEVAERTSLAAIEGTTERELARLDRLVGDRTAPPPLRRGALERLSRVVARDAHRRDGAWLLARTRSIARASADLAFGRPLFDLLARVPIVGAEAEAEILEAIDRFTDAPNPDLVRCAAESFTRLTPRVRVRLRQLDLVDGSVPDFYDELALGGSPSPTVLRAALIDSVARGDRASIDVVLEAIDRAGTTNGADVDAALVRVALRDDRLDVLADAFSIMSPSRGDCFELEAATRVFLAAETPGIDVADLALIASVLAQRGGLERLTEAEASPDPAIADVARKLDRRASTPAPVTARRTERAGACVSLDADTKRAVDRAVALGQARWFTAFEGDSAQLLGEPRVLDCLEAKLGSEELATVLPFVAAPLATTDGVARFVDEIEAGRVTVSPFARLYLAAAAREGHAIERVAARATIARFGALRVFRSAEDLPFTQLGPTGTLLAELNAGLLASTIGDHLGAGEAFASAAERGESAEELFGIAAVSFVFARDFARAEEYRDRTDDRGRLAIELAIADVLGREFDDADRAALGTDDPQLAPRARGAIAPLDVDVPEAVCESRPLGADAMSLLVQRLAQGDPAWRSRYESTAASWPTDPRRLADVARRDPGAFCRDGTAFMSAFSYVAVGANAERRARIERLVPSACAAALAAGADLRAEFEVAILHSRVRIDRDAALAFLASEPRSVSDRLADANRRARIRAANASGQDDLALRLRFEAALSGDLVPVDGALIRNATRLTPYLDLLGVRDPFVEVALGDHENAADDASEANAAFFVALAEELDELDDPAPLVRLLAVPPDELDDAGLAAIARAARTSKAAALRIAERIANTPDLRLFPRAIRSSFARLQSVRALLATDDPAQLGHLLIALERTGVTAPLREVCGRLADPASGEDEYYDEETPFSLSICSRFMPEPEPDDDGEYYDEEY